MQVGLGRDEADRPALGTGSKQRALRTAQHFHPLEIEHARESARGDATDAERPHLDRRVIEVDAGRPRTDRGADAADRDGRDALESRPYNDSRHRARDVLDRPCAEDIEHRAIVRGDADRNIVDGFRSPLSGDNDFLQGLRRGRSGRNLLRCRSSGRITLRRV